MHTIEFFRDVFEYNAWANRKIIDALRSNSSSKSLEILAHLVTTEREYFDRLPGKDSTGFNFWPELTIDDCETLAASTADAYRDLLATDEETLEQTAEYKTSQGVPHTDTWRQLLTQVVMHSATHRGNIMLKLRESGFEPPVIDYIVYLREKA